MNTPPLAIARALLAEALFLALEDLTDDAALGHTPEWDSLAHTRLIMALEDHLQRPVRPEETVSLGSLQDLAALLQAPS
jgi:acyl carrier protein